MSQGLSEHLPVFSLQSLKVGASAFHTQGNQEKEIVSYYLNHMESLFLKLSLQNIPPKAENDSRHRCRDPWLWPQSLLNPDLFLANPSQSAASSPAFPPKCRLS